VGEWRGGNGALGQASHGNRRERENPRGEDLSQPGKKKREEKGKWGTWEREREGERGRKERKERSEIKERKRENEFDFDWSDFL
jgi:hypothetical protein